MRKEAKTERTANIKNINPYHSARNANGGERANAFEGGAKYFASDRAKDLNTVENAKGYGIEWEMTSRLNASGTTSQTERRSES